MEPKRPLPDEKQGAVIKVKSKETHPGAVVKF